MEAQHPPPYTREEIESWDERQTLSVYTDLGLHGGRTHGGRTKLILNYFGIRHLKREAEGGCATPTTAHVGGSRRLGETPEAVRQLPVPGGSQSTAGVGDSGEGRVEMKNGGETVQRHFTASMEQVEAMGHQATQEQEDDGRIGGRGAFGPIRTAPALAQVQTAETHSGAPMGALSASSAPPTAGQPLPQSRPTKRMPPLSNLSRLQLLQLAARPDDAALEQLTDAGLRALLLANAIPRASTDRRADFVRHLTAYLAGDTSRQLAFPASIALERDLQQQAEGGHTAEREMAEEGGEAGGSWAPTEARPPSGPPGCPPVPSRERPPPPPSTQSPSSRPCRRDNPHPRGPSHFHGWRGRGSWAGGTPRSCPTTWPYGWSLR